MGKWKIPSSQDYLVLFKSFLKCDELKVKFFMVWLIDLFIGALKNGLYLCHSRMSFTKHWTRPLSQIWCFAFFLCKGCFNLVGPLNVLFAGHRISRRCF